MSLRAMLAVFDRSESTLAARLVLLALAEYAHDDGSNAFPSIATIQQKARVGERTVFESLKALEASGEIVRAGKTRQGVTIWQLTIAAPAKSAPDLHSEGSSTGSGAKSAPPAADPAPPTAESAPPSPADRARAWSLAHRDLSPRTARDHFEGNLGLEGPELRAAVLYHEERKTP